MDATREGLVDEVVGGGVVGGVSVKGQYSMYTTHTDVDHARYRWNHKYYK